MGLTLLKTERDYPTSHTALLPLVVPSIAMAGRSSHPTASIPASAGRSPSPPCKTCCFGCSKKKLSRKNDMKDGVLGLGPEKKYLGGNEEILSDLGGNEEILSDFSTFSSKEQQQMLKKAMMQEEKASRDAEKVMEWVKQASQRINTSDIDDLIDEK